MLSWEDTVNKAALLLSLGLFGALAACVPPGPTVQLDLNTAEYAAYRATGTASLAGQAFVHRPGGTATCAGRPVFLFPDTPAFRSVIAAARSGAADPGQVNVQAEGDMRSIGRTTVCDAQGNFRFDNLPATAWMVGAEVQRDAPGITEPTPPDNLLALVATSAGLATRVVLTDENRL